jgi:hypothetical protein
MTESEPQRLRVAPETEPACRLALLDSPDDLPSEEELAALRLALTAQVGEPTRLTAERRSPLAQALQPSQSEAPSQAELRALRERRPQLADSARALRPRRRGPRRTAVTALAWLVPFAAAATAASYFLKDRPKPEPAPALSRPPATSPPIAPTVTALPAPSSAPSTTPSSSLSAAPSSSARVNAGPGSAPIEAPKASELDLMRDAKAALAVDPNQALSILNRHARLYPAGVLAQEREVLAIDALLRLGRKHEASARAARFSSNYPASAHWPHIQRSLSNAGL